MATAVVLVDTPWLPAPAVLSMFDQLGRPLHSMSACVETGSAMILSFVTKPCLGFKYVQVWLAVWVA